MQQPPLGVEHHKKAPILDKRPFKGLQHEQGWPSKRVCCARQAGGHTAPGEQIQQQHVDIPSRGHKHVSDINQQQPQQHQLQDTNSGQLLGAAGQDAQQVPGHSQLTDADAIVIVQVMPRRSSYRQVGHNHLTVGRLCWQEYFPPSYCCWTL